MQSILISLYVIANIIRFATYNFTRLEYKIHRFYPHLVILNRHLINQHCIYFRT